MNENNRVKLSLLMCDTQDDSSGKYLFLQNASIGTFLGDIVETEHHFGEGRDAYCYIR